MSLGRAVIVDHRVHAGEIARFQRFVVAGPGADDCWLFIGAIADDGYARFWLGRPEGPKVVRAHRYAIAVEYGAVRDDDTGLHHCDIPLCVRVHPRHVQAGTRADNMAEMGAKRRGGGRNQYRRWYSRDRAGRAARSRALRDAVRDGWDQDAIDHVLGAGVGDDDRPLF